MKDFPDIPTDDPKNIFYLLGQALHSCQNFEHTIQVTVSILAGLGVEGITVSRAREILDGDSSKPLGQLFGILNKMTTINSDGERWINRALAARNNIVHRFIRDNSEKMMSSLGRLEVVAELKKMDQQITDVRDFFMQILSEICKLNGIESGIKSEKENGIKITVEKLPEDTPGV